MATGWNKLLDGVSTLIYGMISALFDLIIGFLTGSIEELYTWFSDNITYGLLITIMIAMFILVKRQQRSKY